MSTFFYEAYDRGGSVKRGEFEAVGEREVVEHLTRQGLTPISVRTMTPGGERSILSFSFFERITPVDAAFVVRNLAVAIRAGMGIVESLDIIINDTKKNLLKTVLRTVSSQVKSGQPLSYGFEMYRKYFPSMFIGMLRAAEASGQLDETLDRLGAYLGKEYALSRKVRSALTYPVILMVGSVAVVGLLLIFVLPRLTKAFTQSGVELPLVTKMLVAVSSFLSSHPLFDLAAVAALVWFFFFFRKTPLGERLFFKVLGKIPVAREIVQKVALIRFARTFGGLVGSGISATEALTLSADSVGNYYYREAITASARDIQNGVPFSDTFKRYPELFPGLFVSLVIVGEKTGSLGGVLTTIADFYEEEVDIKLKDLSSLIEPILLLVMGAVIGSIALSILMPIYQLVGKFT